MNQDHPQDQLLDLLLAIKENQQACRYMPDLNGIPHGEFHMLQLIESLLEETGQISPPPPGIKTSLLSIRSQVSKPAVSQMLKSLEKKQLIERITGDHDRRVVYVRLTDRGHRVITDSQQFFYRFLGKVTEQLGREDTQTLIHLMRRMNQIILSLDWKTMQKESLDASLQEPRKGDPSL